MLHPFFNFGGKYHTWSTNLRVEYWSLSLQTFDSDQIYIFDTRVLPPNTRVLLPHTRVLPPHTHIIDNSTKCKVEWDWYKRETSFISYVSVADNLFSKISVYSMYTIVDTTVGIRFTVLIFNSAVAVIMVSYMSSTLFLFLTFVGWEWKIQDCRSTLSSLKNYPVQYWIVYMNFIQFWFRLFHPIRLLILNENFLSCLIFLVDSYYPSDLVA